MQLIAEIYDVLKELAGLDNPQMADVFSEWNKGMHIAIFLLMVLGPTGREKGEITQRAVVCWKTPRFFLYPPVFKYC